jgi:DNA polymerase-4
VDVLPGIGHVRKRIFLEELNISLVREVAVMDVNSLRLVFGRQAFVIHQRALGIDPTPVYPPRMKPTIADKVTLPQDENDDQKLLGILYGLVERCSQRLRERALVPRKAGLMVRYADQMELTRQIRLRQGSFWDFDLYGPLEETFFKICKRRGRIRSMGVWFRDFLTPSPQLSLFPGTSPGAERNIRVTRALDHIRERHGGEAIRYGRAA